MPIEWPASRVKGAFLSIVLSLVITMVDPQNLPFTAGTFGVKTRPFTLISPSDVLPQADP